MQKNMMSTMNMERTVSMELKSSSEMEQMERHESVVPAADDKFVLMKTENEQYGESVHPFKNDVAMRRSSNKQKNAEGFVLFPKVTKFSTYLISRYGKRVEAELEEMFIGG